MTFTIANPINMIGAMPAVAVRHERRKNKSGGGGVKTTASSILGLQKGVHSRPSALLLKPHLAKGGKGTHAGKHSGGDDKLV